MVVDDEPDGAEMLARVLREQGADPTCVPGGADALERLAVDSFDVFLSDVGMPGMDGFELMRRVRATEKSAPRMVAIAVKAYARAEDRQRALVAGYQMHIAKPIEVPELVAGIASLMHLRAR